MKPKPFKPEIYSNDELYVRDVTTGFIWHRSIYRTLYVDTDRSQVVYHANYLRYFEFGRTSLMRDVAYSYKEIEESGYVYPIFDLGISFYQHCALNLTGTPVAVDPKTVQLWKSFPG